MILWQDIRYGLRMLARNPGFALVVVLILTLGIGINTAVFSFLDHALFRPLPVHRPGELVVVGYRAAQDRSLQRYGDFHYPLYVHYRDKSEAFTGLLACAGEMVDLTIGEMPERVLGAAVSGNYFSVLGVRPALGRTLSPEDDAPDSASVVVISHRLWQRRFGGEPAVLGRTIRVNDCLLTVVGVAPPRFTGTYAGFGMALYVPLHTWARLNGFSPEDRGRTWLMLLGRLKRGVTRDQAQANLQVLTEQVRRVEPLNMNPEIVLSEGSQGYSVWRDEGVWLALAVLQIPAALILVIACANVANLVLARATTRQKEIAVRLGIGASRGAVIHQLLCESAMMALLSGACGALLAHWLSEVLRGTVALAGRIDMPAGVDGRILLFTILVSLATVLAFGLMPALRASRTDVVSMLKDGPGGLKILSRRCRLRHLLVIAQVAVAMVVLVFGALCLRSVRALHALGAGFDPARILAVAVNSREHGRPGPSLRPLLDDLATRAAQWPGVKAVALASGVPLCAEGNQKTGVRQIEGFPWPEGLKSLSIDYDAVSPAYFSMLGVALLRGRHFSVEDGPGSVPVTIVNEAFVQRYWPDQDPIGKRVTCGRGEVREVVGVVRTARLWSLRENPKPTMYWPLVQAPGTKPVLLVRIEGEPRMLASAVRQALAPMGLNAADYDVRTISERISDLLAPQRMIGRGLSLLGLLGLLLAAAGIAGVMAYEVSQRTREIGIRVALGAQRDSVLGLVLRRGMVLTAIGLGLGAGVSLIPAWLLCTLLPEVRRYNDYFLYGARAWDPATYGVVALLLAAVALLACYLPARRAARIDPMAALRYE
jgi:macrolide transport system ATP-binding/permease protein